MKTMVRHSIMSGILVGAGVVINTTAGNKYIGSMLFSLALLTIIQCGLKLYTGKIGFIMTIPIKELAMMLGLNLIGVVIPVLMVATQRPEVMETMKKVSEAKFSNGFFTLFLYACLCGMMMFIAVYCKNTLITVFCIMVFILSGYEHCIADFPYLVINFSMINLVKLFCIIAGNSVGSIVTWYMIKKEDE